MILLMCVFFHTVNTYLFRCPHTPRLAIHLWGENALKIGRWLFGSEMTIVLMNDVKTRQGYIDEDGGRRPGHLVLYPIEVGIHTVQILIGSLQQIYISRCLPMEKSPQCRTSSQTHLLSSKEPRAPICLASWPPSVKKMKNLLHWIKFGKAGEVIA